MFKSVVKFTVKPDIKPYFKFADKSTVQFVLLKSDIKPNVKTTDQLNYTNLTALMNRNK